MKDLLGLLVALSMALASLIIFAGKDIVLKIGIPEKHAIFADIALLTVSISFAGLMIVIYKKHEKEVKTVFLLQFSTNGYNWETISTSENLNALLRCKEQAEDLGYNDLARLRILKKDFDSGELVIIE